MLNSWYKSLWKFTSELIYKIDMSEEYEGQVSKLCSEICSSCFSYWYCYGIWQQNLPPIIGRTNGEQTQRQYILVKIFYLSHHHSLFCSTSALSSPTQKLNNISLLWIFYQQLVRPTKWQQVWEVVVSFRKQFVQTK